MIVPVLNMNNGWISAILEDVKIKNLKELEFAVFCIENIAIRLKKMLKKHIRC